MAGSFAPVMYWAVRTTLCSRSRVFITIGNLPFLTPIMNDYIAIHEEPAWQADHLLLHEEPAWQADHLLLHEEPAWQADHLLLHEEPAWQTDDLLLH